MRTIIIIEVTGDIRSVCDRRLSPSNTPVDVSVENVLRVLCDRSSYHEDYRFNKEDVARIKIIDNPSLLNKILPPGEE